MRFAKALSELMDQCETADDMVVRADRACKYKKDKDGNRITAPLVGAITQEIMGVISDLVGDIRTVRAHAPKPDPNVPRDS